MSIAEKLTTIAENEQKVYEAGVKAERERFWSRYLHGGERAINWTSQTGFFEGVNFGFNNFYPTCDIKPTGDASYLFYAWENKQGDSKGSLKRRLEECGVVLDTSKATKLTNAFSYSHITEIPTIDCTGLVGASAGVFAHGYSRLKSIEKLIVKENTTFKSWFLSTSLTEIRFEGTIGQSLDVSYSANGVFLSVESMKNIISCLKNYSGTDSEFTYKLSFAEASWTTLEADSTAPDGNTWREYVATLGWLT